MRNSLCKGESFTFDTNHLGYNIKVCVLLFLFSRYQFDTTLAHGILEKKVERKQAR